MIDHPLPFKSSQLSAFNFAIYNSSNAVIMLQTFSLNCGENIANALHGINTSISYQPKMLHSERNHVQLMCQSGWISTLDRNRVIYVHLFSSFICHHQWKWTSQKPIVNNSMNKYELHKCCSTLISYAVLSMRVCGAQRWIIIIYWDWQFR